MKEKQAHFKEETYISSSVHIILAHASREGVGFLYQFIHTSYTHLYIHINKNIKNM